MLMTAKSTRFFRRAVNVVVWLLTDPYLCCCNVEGQKSSLVAIFSNFVLIFHSFQVHFRRIIALHTDVNLGDCSFLDTCRHMKVTFH